MTIIQLLLIALLSSVSAESLLCSYEESLASKSCTSTLPPQDGKFFYMGVQTTNSNEVEDASLETEVKVGDH